MKQLLVMALVLVAGTAWANCGPSQRIDVEEADCLDGEWTNRMWPNHDTAWVENKCADLGTVVAKVDRANANDWTKTLDSDARESMSGAGTLTTYVRGISCCSDLSELCNRIEIENEEMCEARFNQSPASQGLEGTGGPMGCDFVQAKLDEKHCAITADCSWYIQRSVHRVLEYAKTTEQRTTTCHLDDVSGMTFYEDGGRLECE